MEVKGKLIKEAGASNSHSECDSLSMRKMSHRRRRIASEQLWYFGERSTVSACMYRVFTSVEYLQISTVYNMYQHPPTGHHLRLLSLQKPPGETSWRFLVYVIYCRSFPSLSGHEDND